MLYANPSQFEKNSYSIKGRAHGIKEYARCWLIGPDCGVKKIFSNREEILGSRMK